MFTISLQAAIYILLLLLLLAGWLIWQYARQQPLFDKHFWAVWNVSPFGVVLLSPLLHPLFVNRRAHTLLQLEEQIALAEAEVLQGITTQIEHTAAAQHFSLTVAEDQVVAVWCGRFGRNRLLILRNLNQQRQQEQATQLFWSNISHELRTPMTSILSHLALLRLDTISAEVQAESLDIIEQQAQRLSRLVQNSLELGQLKATALSDKTIIDLILIAEEAIAEMILLAERQDNHLTLICGDVGLNVYANQDKLKQVLVNLLDNSLKYCLAGDSVTVTVAESESMITCTVADTGNGIPQQHLARITEQFYRADRQHPGSGLGLAIVKEIVQQHDGQLTITSATEGHAKGTCVTISLPKLPSTTQTPPETL